MQRTVCVLIYFKILFAKYAHKYMVCALKVGIATSVHIIATSIYIICTRTYFKYISFSSVATSSSPTRFASTTGSTSRGQSICCSSVT